MKKKRKEIIISSIFFAFILVVFIYSFYFSNAEDTGMEGVSARAVAKVDKFTDKLTTVPGLAVALLVAVTVLVAYNYTRKRL